MLLVGFKRVFLLTRGISLGYGTFLTGQLCKKDINNTGPLKVTLLTQHYHFETTRSALLSKKKKRKKKSSTCVWVREAMRVFLSLT